MDRDPAGTYDHPFDVDILDGEVVIIGPGPAGIALTAKAAAESASRLAEAASRAFGSAPDTNVAAFRA